jgi:aryl-alcohol dehydrogenase-like predicted oxidoreductase
VADAHDSFADNDKCHDSPRFSAHNFDHNRDRLAPLWAVAANAGCTVPQVALAWLLSRGSNVVPIPGTRRIEHLQSNAEAADVELSVDDLQLLDSATFATRASRHAERALCGVNSNG